MPRQSDVSVARNSEVQTESHAADHRHIALRYLWLLFIFGGIGAFTMLIARLEQLSPGPNLVSSTTFAVLFSTHGILMFHFALAPAFLGVLANVIVPIQVGADRTAFPRLNRMSWYLFGTGGVLVLISMLCGGAGGGWIFDAASADPITRCVALAAIGVLCASLSLILLSVNLLTTIASMRAPTMTWRDIPIFSWSVSLASIVLLLSSPLLALAMSLLVIRFLFNVDLFELAAGGDPVLFRKLLGMYRAPAIVAIALPMLGFISDQVAQRVRQPDRVLRTLLSAIAVLSFFLWGRRFAMGGAVGVADILPALATSMMSAIFLAIIVIWIVRLARGGAIASPASPFLIVAVLVLAVGVCTGATLGLPVLNRYLHNSYYMTAHVHITMIGAVALTFFGGLHLIWRELTGRDPRLSLSRKGLGLTMAGLLVTFVPLFLLGVMGAVRRQYHYPNEFHVLNVIATLGAFALFIGIWVIAASFVFSKRNVS